MTPRTTTLNTPETETNYNEMVQFQHDFNNPFGIPGYIKPSFGRVRQGSWGKVYEAEDPTGKKVAIKQLAPTLEAQQQEKERGWTPETALENEARDLLASKHVVPAKIERYNGTSSLVMPWYEHSLAHILEREEYGGLTYDEFRKNWDEGGSVHYKPGVHPQLAFTDQRVKILNKWRKENIPQYLQDLAEGLKDIHQLLQRAHGDLKPDNIMVGPEGLLINDLGTSTRISNDPSAGNRGFPYTRAPECWQGQKQTPASDCYAFGALLVRLTTGHYPFEKEIDNSKDPRAYFATTHPDILQRILDQEIKKLPRNLRTLAKKTLQINPDLRYENAAPLPRAVELATKQGFLGTAQRQFTRWGIPLTLAAGAIGGGVWLSNLPHAPQPEPPKIIATPELMPVIERYSREDGLKLPPRILAGMGYDYDMLYETLQKETGLSPQEANIAVREFPVLMANRSRITPSQIETYKRLAGIKDEYRFSSEGKTLGETWHLLAASIKEAAQETRAATPTGQPLDLEDLLTRAILGKEKFQTLQQESMQRRWQEGNGLDYKNYRTLLEEDLREMIDQWLAQIR
ncbi:MAG: protein kinase [Nanoarchaeota archaeon]|nr:protein kinase [Nanoarchaeota archaeon]